jgi:hypothetical protein
MLALLPKARRRSRSLRFESLESRLALTGLPLPDLGSLDAYLALPPVMGPVMEQVAPVAIPAASLTDSVDVAAIDTVLEQVVAVPPGVGSLEGEGEEMPPPLPPPVFPPLLPTLLTFSAEHADGGWVRLSGSISATISPTTMIQFGGLFSGHMTTCDSSGHFTYFVLDPGIAGMVTAQVAGSSTVLSSYLG